MIIKWKVKKNIVRKLRFTNKHRRGWPELEV